MITAAGVLFERDSRLASQIDGAFPDGGASGPTDDSSASQLAAKLAARHFPDQVNLFCGCLRLKRQVDATELQALFSAQQDLTQVCFLRCSTRWT